MDPLPLPLLLQEGVVRVRRTHEFGLLSAGLGAAGSQDQSDEDDHEDQDGDDGQEYPDQRGHIEGLSEVGFRSPVSQYLIVLKKIGWKV